MFVLLAEECYRRSLLLEPYQSYFFLSVGQHDVGRRNHPSTILGKTLDLLYPRWCLEPKWLYCFYRSEYKPADLSRMFDETHVNHGDLSDFVCLLVTVVFMPGIVRSRRDSSLRFIDSSEGDTPVVECGVRLYTNRKRRRLCSILPLPIHLSPDLTVCTALSSSPFEEG